MKESQVSSYQALATSEQQVSHFTVKPESSPAKNKKVPGCWVLPGPSGRLRLTQQHGPHSERQTQDCPKMTSPGKQEKHLKTGGTGRKRLGTRKCRIGATLTETPVSGAPNGQGHFLAMLHAQRGSANSGLCSPHPEWPPLETALAAGRGPTPAVKCPFPRQMH